MPYRQRGTVRVLVDADNVAPARLQPLLDALVAFAGSFTLTASGRPSALAALDWPEGSELLPSAGWQRADAALAESYRPAPQPLILVTGDGDFALLAARHPGPVLVISAAASGRLREATTVVDPALDGVEGIRAWLATYAVD